MTIENCILIPVHPPKANWLFQFLSSIRANLQKDELPDFQIVLIASNFEDLRFFSRLATTTPLSPSIRLICAEDYLAQFAFPGLTARLQANTDLCAVNLKKFVGLHWAMTQGIAWVACIDSDTAAAGPVDELFDGLRRNYASHQYFASLTPNNEAVQNVNRTCRSAFGDEMQAELLKANKDDSLYPWFFDVPFYNSADVSSFFSDMERHYGSLGAFMARLNWNSFEHVLFIFWRILNQGCKLIDYSETGVHGVPEHLGVQGLAIIQARHNYTPMWASAPEFWRNPDLLKVLSPACLLFHMDRTY